jgi:hypothetical protein
VGFIAMKGLAGGLLTPPIDPLPASRKTRSRSGIEGRGAGKFIELDGTAGPGRGDPEDVEKDRASCPFRSAGLRILQPDGGIEINVSAGSCPIKRSASSRT